VSRRTLPPAPAPRPPEEPGRNEDPRDGVRAAAEKFGVSSIMELVRLGSDATSETVRVAALREVLDRGFGRPPSATPKSGETQTIYLILDDGYDA
jgi:hypothetical protein